MCINNWEWSMQEVKLLAYNINVFALFYIILLIFQYWTSAKQG
jgi:hypothetical protein